MVAYNEADVIGACIGALAEQGCDVYLIDHGSTDGTAEIAREWLGRGLVHVERFPEDSGFPARNANEMVWVDLLRRREQVVGEHDYDWYVLNDADEFRESPVARADVRRGPRPRRGARLQRRLLPRARLPPGRRPLRAGHRPARGAHRVGERQRGRRRAGEGVQAPADGSLDIVNRAGHDVRFTGRRVCPVQFILRHYPIRSPEHGMRKVLKERLPRFAAEERKAGWHVQYDQLVAEGAKFVWEPSELDRVEPGRGARGAARPRARPAAAGDDRARRRHRPAGVRRRPPEGARRGARRAAGLARRVRRPRATPSTPSRAGRTSPPPRPPRAPPPSSCPRCCGRWSPRSRWAATRSRSPTRRRALAAFETADLPPARRARGRALVRHARARRGAARGARARRRVRRRVRRVARTRRW